MSYKFHYNPKKISDEEKDEMKNRIFRPRSLPYFTQDKEKGLYEYQPERTYVNTVQDFFSHMGANPNERVAPPAHYDKRSIRIDNASNVPVGIGINNSPYNAPKNKNFIIQPGDYRYVLVNSYGGSPQYIWPLNTDPELSKVYENQKYDVEEYMKNICTVVGRPRIIENNANAYVLKSGIEGIWIVTFQYPTPKAG